MTNRIGLQVCLVWLVCLLCLGAASAQSHIDCVTSMTARFGSASEEEVARIIDDLDAASSYDALACPLAALTATYVHAPLPGKVHDAVRRFAKRFYDHYTSANTANGPIIVRHGWQLREGPLFGAVSLLSRGGAAMPDVVTSVVLSRQFSQATRLRAIDCLVQGGGDAHLQAVCRQLVACDDRDNKYIGLYGLSKSATLDCDVLAMIEEEITTPTLGLNYMLIPSLQRENMTPEMIAVAMRLAMHLRDKDARPASSLLSSVALQEPELVRPYSREVLTLFRDARMTDRGRGTALVVLGQLGITLPNDEVVAFYENCSTSEGQSYALQYCKAGKCKLPEADMSRLVQHAKNKHVLSDIRTAIPEAAGMVKAELAKRPK